MISLILYMLYIFALTQPSRQEEWRTVQYEIAQFLPKIDPFSVSMEKFHIITESEAFYCGDTGLQAVLLVMGCFITPEPDDTYKGTIRYVASDPKAFKHEARHAILYALNYEKWDTYGH